MGRSTGHAAGLIAAASLLVCVVTYAFLWTSTAPGASFAIQPTPSVTTIEHGDELQVVLRRASMGNKTVIITVINSAYVEDNGMLDLFLRSMREGEDTEYLIKHVLLVAADAVAFKRCELLRLNCYRLVTEGVEFSEEAIYESEDFIKMMWRRTLFLGDVLRHGYNFIFTDMDVMWLRDPLPKLNHDREDMQLSCDSYNGNPTDEHNPFNTGFYMVASNNKTIALFDEWYGKRHNATGKDQDVLSQMRYEGVFRRLGMKVRFLDTLHFSGFCQDSRDFREVRTVHANCCRLEKAKLSELTDVLEVWKRFNRTANATWPAHKICHEAWETDVSKYELQLLLKRISMEKKTLVISFLNMAQAEENGMLDLFLKSLRQGADTEPLIKHLLFVSVDRAAFDRCKLLQLRCYRLLTYGVDFSKDLPFTAEELNRMMWRRVQFLGDVLKLGYSFVSTNVDVMWLKNPFTMLSNRSEDMQMSCDSHDIDAGFYFAVSSSRTTALFDTWYSYQYNYPGMKEDDVLRRMRSDGVFPKLGVRVRFLDALYFGGGFCQSGGDVREAITVHANCCRDEKAKLAGLTSVIDVWKSSDGETVSWPEHKACT